MGSSKNVVGFVGFDDISLDLAASLVGSGYAVQAFDSQLDSPLMVEFSKRLGGTRCANAVEATKGVSAIILLIPHPAQIADMIFGQEGLKKNVVVVLHTVTVSAEVQKLEKCLTEEYEINAVVDAHIYRGTSEDLNGKIMVISSGKSSAINVAHPVLSAMSEKLFVLEGEIGAGSKVKMVTELLEAIHLVASVEAICLGVQAKIHPWILYDIISNAAGCSHVGGEEGNAPLFKVWEKVLGIKLDEAANEETYNPLELARELESRSKLVNRVGFIGLGAMGFGMATHLLKSNLTVVGYDVYKPTLCRFIEAGGLVGNSPLEVAEGADVLVIMVTNEAQAESVLFGDLGAVQALSAGATIILSSTVSPAYVNQLDQRLKGKNLKLVDAPVSGGVKRASSGTLTVMASGTDEALEQCISVLSALSEKLYIIKGGCGAGSCVKMVNQLLAGVHIASAAEALAFGARLGLPTRNLFQIMTTTSGTSWMLENRGPHMVDNDFTPYSALNIFVKDLGIVSHECSSRKIPLHVAVTAHQLFLAGSAAGWGALDDAAVVKFYESLTGVKVEGKLPVLSKEHVMKSLPPEWPVDLTSDIIKLCENNRKPLVVLDDDPTGTQTVHDIEVLTEWSIDKLVEQFRKNPKCFFILTNSRALSSNKASALVAEICRNLQTAAKSADIEFTVVLRGDSTLRGHFPQEADAVISVLGDIDAWIICPFFLQGGRFTIGDVHYVAEADRLVPAGDTEFAKDSAFGYKSSNLRQWVEEKTEGRIAASNVVSVSIDLLRKGGPNAVCEHLCSLEKGSTCIINAASERDMAVFAAGMILAELKGKRYLCRTAASFVSARIGITSRPPISPKDLGIHKETTGGLIIVGSYVPKTTRQVEELKVQLGHALRWIEIPVDKVAMKSPEERAKEINEAAELADIYLKNGMDTVIMTSRDLISGRTPSESLEINFKVSSALVEIVRLISTRPRYILAKGGITSSDIATKALDTRLAKVAGQALAGVPLWQLGGESRHPGVPYIVFPGNVGDHKALAEVVQSWARPAKIISTKELLLNAEKGGYAVGAFNVYNLEGIASVVAAAEEECSPAILQIHPGALKQGGITLVACCLSAAEKASVPITVHFDHGTSKPELIEMLELKNICVEAELGRLSGTEDDLTVEEYEARLTDINQAEEFIDKTGIDALAVCIGNVHGKYPANGPNLRLDLLKDLHVLASKKGVVLVLHGASGVPKDLVKSCIDFGVRKFNVNTEVRKAYMDSLTNPGKDLVNVLASAKDAMKAVVVEKMRLFGSSGKA
uniref:Ketose-bisphosphate aldolase class-II family protein n=1 Tax=Chenopodium quinoa TaxID=63459 RepID=A0A803MVE7_CHEQI